MPPVPVMKMLLQDAGSLLIRRVKRNAEGTEEGESVAEGQEEEVSGSGDYEYVETGLSTTTTTTMRAITRPFRKHLKHISTTPIPITTTTEGTWKEMKHGVEQVAKTTHIPFSAVLLILLVIFATFAALFYFCLQKWWRKFKESDRAKGFKGIDLKSVNLITSMGKEKVQPDTDELTANMEENEEVQQGKGLEKENLKLGRLQFKLDYDFNSNNVSVITVNLES